MVCQADTPSQSNSGREFGNRGAQFLGCRAEFREGCGNAPAPAGKEDVRYRASHIDKEVNSLIFNSRCALSTHIQDPPVLAAEQ